MTCKETIEKYNPVYTRELCEYSPKDYKQLIQVYNNTCQSIGLSFDKKAKTKWDKKRADESYIRSSKQKLARVYVIKYTDIFNETFYGKMSEPEKAIEVFLSANETARNLIKHQSDLTYTVFYDFGNFIQTLIEKSTKPQKSVFFDKEIYFDRETKGIDNDFRFYLKSF